MGLVIFGIVLLVVGLVLTFTVVGAIFGVPIMIVGGILVLAGARRRTVIHVTHTNAPVGDTPSNQAERAKQR